MFRTVSRQEISNSAKIINAVGEGPSLHFLTRNGLAPLWFDFIINNGLKDDYPETFIEALKKQKQDTAALLLIQTRVLEQAHAIFEKEKIPYLVFKGADLRHTIYDDPAHRPVVDIDVLVPASEKQRAIGCLAAAGFDFHPCVATVSHEAKLIMDGVTIDLHWKFMRPGRTRTDLTNYLLAHRTRSGQFWGTGYQASLIIMLVHPVFTKQLNSPSSMLVHLVDLHKLTGRKEIDWEGIVNTLDETGTKTAAWCSLYLLQQVTGEEEHVQILQRLKPGHLHERYLRLWIDRDLINRFWEFRFFVRGFFDLALQDSVADALRAIILLGKSKKTARKELKDLRKLYREKYYPPVRQ